MKLRSLNIRAFGPFAGEVRIDFDVVGQSGIFLLEGPTGSGKSTIIDAIVYALYGGLAGSQASDERLRSGFAAAEVESVADLVFETSSGLFRIRRTPPYDRPKQRGAGTTKQNSTVRMWRLTEAGYEQVLFGGRAPSVDGVTGNGAVDHGDLDVAGELIGEKADAVGVEVLHAVGLSRAQFLQTVVLPQGEFAKFLQSNAEARTEVLLQVFQAQAYKSAEIELQKRRAALEKGARESKLAAESAIERLGKIDLGVEADEPEDSDSLAESVVPVELGLHVENVVDLAGKVLDAAKRRSAEAVSHEKAARALETSASEALRVNQELVKAVALRDAARARRADLDGKSETIAVQTERLELSTKAAIVNSRSKSARTAQTAEILAEVTLSRAIEDIGEHGITVPAADEDSAVPSAEALAALDVWSTKQRDSATGFESEIAALNSKNNDLEQLVAENRRAAKAVKKAQESLVAEEEKSASIPAKRTELSEELATIGELAASVPTEQASTDRTGEAVKAATSARTSWAEALKGRVNLFEVSAVALDAIANEKVLREARIKGIAGEIANSLNAGDPCPVCGSEEHPNLAALDDDHVSVEQVEAAEDERKKAEDKVDACRETAAQSREQLRISVELAGIDFNVDSALDQALSEQKQGTPVEEPTPLINGESGAKALQVVAKTQLAAAKVAQKKLTQLNTQLEELAMKEKSLAESLSEAKIDLSTKQANAAHAANRLAEEQAALLTSLTTLCVELDVVVTEEPSNTLASAATQVAERKHLFTALGSAATTLKQARTVAKERVAEADAAMVEQGFDSWEAASALLLEDAERAELKKSVETHNTAVAAISAELNLPAVTALPDTVTDNSEQLQSTLGEQIASLGVARTKVSQLEAIAMTVASSRDEIEDAVTAYREQIAANAAVIRVADLVTAASPDNQRHLTLSTYVLLQRFESMVEAANERLLEISDGRYELLRSDEREKGAGQKLGLALEIQDHITGKTRHPKTLSGGETFYVSLCLALGLADVVTAEAGGVEFGTLFIDEGFGTLDGDTLDSVMTQMQRLRDAGRTVGMVSHVDLLKQMVPERIEVRRRANGSSLVKVVA